MWSSPLPLHVSAATERDLGANPTASGAGLCRVAVPSQSSWAVSGEAAGSNLADGTGATSGLVASKIPDDFRGDGFQDETHSTVPTIFRRLAGKGGLRNKLTATAAARPPQFTPASADNIGTAAVRDRDLGAGSMFLAAAMRAEFAYGPGAASHQLTNSRGREPRRRESRGGIAGTRCLPVPPSSTSQARATTCLTSTTHEYPGQSGAPAGSEIPARAIAGRAGAQLGPITLGRVGSTGRFAVRGAAGNRASTRQMRTSGLKSLSKSAAPPTSIGANADVVHRGDLAAAGQRFSTRERSL
jgi:hypothetical protein